MTRQILCTVGTSLLTNRDKRPWSGWNPREKTPLPDETTVTRWLQSASPAEASAETNTLRALELEESDHLAFLHSDTPEGVFCAERLKNYYTSRCPNVSLRKIQNLGYGADNFTTGLKGLVSLAVKLAGEGEKSGRQPVFCATGGFKAEIAFLNLLGALLEIEVVYIHELHRKLVVLPRLPLAWDHEFVRKHDDFFIWIDEEPRLSQEVESWLKGKPELRSLVEDDGKGHTFLSAAGDLLFKAARARLDTGPRAIWPETVLCQPKEKNGVSGVEHHRPEGWESFVNRLCSIDCVEQVRFDTEAYGGSRVKVLDATKGIIGIRFGNTGSELPLRVETTARGDAQSELVAKYLRECVKKYG
jgi:putative CRISPR-associated protein (TIGR02619 family)